jgi:hypothetical protein
VEHLDAAKYWAAAQTPPGASGPQPPASPSWLEAAQWTPPEAKPSLSFSRPDRAPTVEPSWDHLWPAESPPPKSWHERSLDALHSLDEALWHATPPELRPKVAAVVQLLKTLLPGSGTVDSTEAGAAAEEARREGRYGAYAGNLASGMLSAASDWFPALKGAAAPIGKALIVGGSAISPARRLEAESIEKAGKSADEIWRTLRMDRTHGGEWISEIPDAGYRVVPVGRKKPLYEHHDHPAMKETFPELGQIESHLRIRPSMRPKETFRPDELEVRAPDLETARWLGIHGLQHAIDHHIGHPRGGSVDEFLRRGDPYPTAYSNYQNLAGEARARLAMDRLSMSEEERLARRPSTMEYPPRDRQIVRYREK